VSEPGEPNIYSGPDIGSALKALREQRRLSLEALADMTRVRRAYLADIEAMRLDRLPSRPFTIGYIRAYAQALGLDGEAAVERFKAEEPILDEPLRNPTGIGDTGDPRIVAIVGGVVVILVAIILWNIAQRAMLANAPPPPTASAQAAAKALSQSAPQPVTLGMPLPAPVESTTPPPYETPGMPIITPDGTVTKPVLANPKLLPTAPPDDPATLPPYFQVTGQVYGAPKDQPSVLILQALKPASLVIRGQDGQIYFARQFAAGDAFRVPSSSGLMADVAQPNYFQVFVGGRSKGVLPAPQVLLSKLAEAAAPSAPAPAPVTPSTLTAPPAPQKPAPAAPANPTAIPPGASAPH
jgi:transcriptional regulator with XRE-family HTH domain